jgi:hypothetical protein
VIHTYERVKDKDLYTVGIYTPIGDGEWCWEEFEEFTSEEDARRLVNYLNGGDGKAFVY